MFCLRSCSMKASLFLQTQLDVAVCCTVCSVNASETHSVIAVKQIDTAWLSVMQPH